MSEVASRPVIAIIGRPNVGKSTLFNRILGGRSAIVDDIPGVTRDRNYADSSYQGRPFRLVDTGGLDPGAKDGMLALIKQQSQIAIAEADLLILVLDGRAGLTPPDEEIVTLLRRTRTPVLLAVNKIDTPKLEPLLADFYRLGKDGIYPVSAEHGIGVDDLLEAVLPRLPAPSLDDQAEGARMPRVAIVGRPNVGKSSLLNTVFGGERVLVSEIPGTTRDAIDTVATYEGRSYLFTDTAGIRRRGRIDRGVEHYSVARALEALGRSDVAVIVLDAVEGLAEQDTKIVGQAVQKGRGCVLFVNKWDAIPDGPAAQKAYLAQVRRRVAFLRWAPVLFGSAVTREGIGELFSAIDRVMTAFSKRIPTGSLNKHLQQLIEKNPLPLPRGRSARSVFMTQVATKPPTFAFFVGRPQDVTPAYLRYLENGIRERYDFAGVPIRILVRQK